MLGDPRMDWNKWLLWFSERLYVEFSENQGSILSRFIKYLFSPQRPYCFWCPYGLLLRRYLVPFPRDYGSRSVRLTTHLCPGWRLSMCGAAPSRLHSLHGLIIKHRGNLIFASISVKVNEFLLQYCSLLAQKSSGMYYKRNNEEHCMRYLLHCRLDFC
jgi:hypothetical protein